MRRRFQSVVDVFAVLGAIAAIVSALVAVRGAQQAPVAGRSVVERFRLGAAEVLAPTGYAVQRAAVATAGDAEPFLAPADAPVMLPGGVPVNVQPAASRRAAFVAVDGVRHTLHVGDRVQVAGTDCFLHLLAIDAQKTSTLQLRCGTDGG